MYENKTLGISFQYPENCPLNLQDLEGGVIFFDKCTLSIQKFNEPFSTNYVPYGGKFLGEVPIGDQKGKKYFTQHPLIGFEGMEDTTFIKKVEEGKINFVVYLVITDKKNYFEIHYNYETEEEKDIVENIIASMKFL